MWFEVYILSLFFYFWPFVPFIPTFVDEWYVKIYYYPKQFDLHAIVIQNTCKGIYNLLIQKKECTEKVLTGADEAYITFSNKYFYFFINFYLQKEVEYKY